MSTVRNIASYEIKSPAGEHFFFLSLELDPLISRGRHSQAAILRTTDRGQSWSFLPTRLGAWRKRIWQPTVIWPPEVVINVSLKEQLCLEFRDFAAAQDAPAFQNHTWRALFCEKRCIWSLKRLGPINDYCGEWQIPESIQWVTIEDFFSLCEKIQPAGEDPLKAEVINAPWEENWNQISKPFGVD